MIPDTLHIGPIPIHVFGLMLAVAFLAAGHVLGREFARKGYDEDLASSAVLWCAVGSLVGARLWLVVEDWPIPSCAIRSGCSSPAAASSSTAG